MPCDYRNYPQNWKVIRARILDRALHKCERCGVRNYEMVSRMPSGDWVRDTGLGPVVWSSGGPVKQVRVVLTVAHLNHDVEDNRDENLMALCQRCHLRYDREQHLQTRIRNKEVGTLLEKLK